MEISQALFFGVALIFGVGLYFKAYKFKNENTFIEYIKFLGYCLVGLSMGLMIAIINGYNIKDALIGLVVTPAMYSIFVIIYSLLLSLVLTVISDVIYLIIEKLKSRQKDR